MNNINRIIWKKLFKINEIIFNTFEVNSIKLIINNINQIIWKKLFKINKIMDRITELTF